MSYTSQAFFDSMIDNTLKNYTDMLITLDHSRNKHPWSLHSHNKLNGNEDEVMMKKVAKSRKLKISPAIYWNYSTVLNFKSNNLKRWFQITGLSNCVYISAAFLHTDYQREYFIALMLQSHVKIVGCFICFLSSPNRIVHVHTWANKIGCEI